MYAIFLECVCHTKISLLIFFYLLSSGNLFVSLKLIPNYFGAWPYMMLGGTAWALHDTIKNAST